MVVGLGRTGISVVRYLRAHGTAVAVTDTRTAPPALPELRALAPEIKVSTGALDAKLLEGADAIVVSPGIAARGEFFDAARARGLPVFGDIELFARAVRAPVVGITGTNGKSTVTTLVGQMAERSGRRTRVGGNLGEPALELLDPRAELYVLELSSYQLDTTESLTLAAATVLNVTPIISIVTARWRTTPPRRRASSGTAAPRCSTRTIRRSRRWAPWRIAGCAFPSMRRAARSTGCSATPAANGSRAVPSGCWRSMN